MRFSRDNDNRLFLDGQRIGILIGAPFNVLETLNALTDEIRLASDRECEAFYAGFAAGHTSGIMGEDGLPSQKDREWSIFQNLRRLSTSDSDRRCPPPDPDGCEHGTPWHEWCQKCAPSARDADSLTPSDHDKSCPVYNLQGTGKPGEPFSCSCTSAVDSQCDHPDFVFHETTLDMVCVRCHAPKSACGVTAATSLTESDDD